VWLFALRKPFRSIDELALVLGMTPELPARLRPHLTLCSTYGPTRASTDPVSRGAIRFLREPGDVLPYELDASGVLVVHVTASAVGADGASFTCRATLRLDRRSKQRPSAILAWNHRSIACSGKRERWREWAGLPMLAA
jgi:general secretion pathway protein K